MNWIKTSEQLPESFCTVILFRIDQNEVFAGYYDYDDECFYPDDASDISPGAIIIKKVTHWMPMPDKPKD